MAKTSNKNYWDIRGYDSSESIFKTKVETGLFTDDQIEHLLKALAAKAGLTYEEIVGAYAKRRARISNSLLDVHKDYPTYMCGTNPVFTATRVDAHGNRLKRPKLA